jgi:enterochelin esterase family protein
MQKEPIIFYSLCLVLGLAVSACSVSAAISTKPTSTLAITQTLPATVAPTTGPSPSPACLASAGTTRQVNFHSKELGEIFTATIYFPPCYDANLAGGYPVIYLFHGQNMDDTFWPSIGATGIADQVIRAGQPAFLMVFPYEVHNFDLAGDSKFGDAVIKELIPYVEKSYNVCTTRQCREIGGVSRGGGWAMHLGLTNFDMFSAIGAHSMGWFQGDLYRVQNLLKVHSVSDFPRIYIDRGDQDYLRDSIDIYEKNLTATGVVHVYTVNPGSHEKAYWQSQVQNYINWYVQGFTGLN